MKNCAIGTKEFAADTILSLLATKSPTCIYLNMKTFMKGKKNPRSYRKLLIYPFKSSCATIPFRKKIRALF
jgi:hypothetical protein